MEITSAQMDKELTLETVDVKIRGHQYISKKLFEVVTHILVDNGVAGFKCINEIIFSEDEPEGKCGVFNIETLNITINLLRNFDFACEIVKDMPLSTLSLRSHLWFSLLTVVIHEILHGMAYKLDPEKMINSDRDVIEEEIKKETSDYIKNLIRDYDVEPPEMADEPLFSSLYAEFYVKHIKENSEQWAINQAIVHDTGFIWKDGDCVCNTFREWYRINYDHAKDLEWDNEVKPLETVEVIDEAEETTDVVIVVDDKTADTPDVIELRQLAAEKAGETAAVEEPSLPAAVDPEALALLDIDEPIEINMEEGFSTGYSEPVAAKVAPYKELVEDPTKGPPPAAPVQQELPLKHSACASCSTTLTKGAKFCSHCGTSVETTPKPDVSGPANEVVVTQVPATPQPVAANQPQFSYGAKRPMRHDLPNYNLSAEQIRACVGEVFIRCYQHIFSKCGFAPGQNPSFAPELRNAVMEPISVVGIPYINEILIGMDSLDPLNGNFTWCVPPVNGMIRGKITKNLGLPSYTLYFNFNGHEAKRLIMPQNQWKVSGQGYSAPAQKAQQGATIIWMMDGDDSTVGQKWRAKIENDTLEWLI